MSMQTGDHHTDEVVQDLIAGFQQLLRHARGLVNRFRQRINRQQRMRMMMERYRDGQGWGPGNSAQQQRPAEARSQDAELAARLTEERDALQAEVDASGERIQRLEVQSDQLNRDNDAANAQQRAADERRNQVDGNDNGLDDNVDADNQLAQQNQDEQDLQDAERREDQRDQEAADREKRDDQERKGREEADTGVGPGEAAGAAAGAAIAAEEIDEQLDKQDAQAEAENGAENEAGQADNQTQAEADNQTQAEADNEQGVDGNATNDTERVQAADQAVNPEQQTGTDVENPAPGVDQQTNAEVQNAAADPSQAADNQLEADSAEQGTSPSAMDAQDLGQSNDLQAEGPQQESQGPQAGGSTIAIGNGMQVGPDGVQGANVVDWDTERDGTHINATNADPNTVYRIPEGQSVSFSYNGGADQDSPGMDMQDMGRDAAGSNREAINLGDISGDNQTFVVDQNGVHQGVQDGDRTVAQAGQQAGQGQQQPQETIDQPAFPTAGDQEAANRVEQQSMQQTEQGGQNAQRADQVAARDAQEKPVLDDLRAENAASRAQQPQGQSQMSPDEIDAQKHRTGAGLEHASGSPGYDGGEGNTGASGGERQFADRSRSQGSRGADRGNDGSGLSK